MAKIGKHPCPIMRSVRGFHADQTSQQISKEAGYRIATQRLSHDDFSEAVDAMNLEYILRKIQTYSNDLQHPPSLQLAFENFSLGGRGPYHSSLRKRACDERSIGI
jgi:hypothetical protein